MSKEQNKSSSCEMKLLNHINCVFTAPYNLGVCVLALVLFILTHEFTYYAAGNFSMTSLVGNSIMLFSAVAILVGIINQNNKGNCQSVVKLALLTFILNLFSIIFSKIMLFSAIGVFILTPLAYFCFFLTVKHLYLLSQ